MNIHVYIISSILFSPGTKAVAHCTIDDAFKLIKYDDYFKDA